MKEFETPEEHAQHAALLKEHVAKLEAAYVVLNDYHGKAQDLVGECRAEMMIEMRYHERMAQLPVRANEISEELFA